MISAERQFAAYEAPPHETHRELVKRVLASSTFLKSKRLSSLFEYVCDLTLNGRASEINEQSLGEAVFNRPRDYDSAIDGIVRTQASRLRQKLDLYFGDEGAGEPIRITIPRGSYVTVFEKQSLFEQSPPALADRPEAPIGEQRGAVRQDTRPSVFAWALVVVLAIALGTVVYRDFDRRTKTVPFSVAQHLLWSQIFPSSQRTLLVPRDSSLVISEGLRGRTIDLAEYVSGTYRAEGPAEGLSRENLAAHLANARYTSIVDLEVAAALSTISQSQMSGIEVRYPREVRPRDLKQGNLIFVGASEANPWVTLFERNMNFVFFNNRTSRVFSVLNRSPRDQEPVSGTPHTAIHCIAFMPSLLICQTSQAAEACSFSRAQAWRVPNARGTLYRTIPNSCPFCVRSCGRMASYRTSKWYWAQTTSAAA